MKKIVEIIFKVILIVWAVLLIYSISAEFNFDQITVNGQVRELSSAEGTMYGLVFGIIFVAVSYVMPPFSLMIMYLIYQRKVRNKIRINSKFDKENLGYCREHLNGLSPGIISYLKDFNIEFKKDISAHILKLFYEGYLIEESNKIKVSDKDISLLKETDQFVLNLVDNQNYTNIDVKEYEKLVEKELREEGLITNSTKEWRKVIIKFISSIFTLIFAFNLLPIFFTLGNDNFVIILIAVVVLVVVGEFALQISFVTNIIVLLKSKTSIIRTNKGNKLVKNIYSLEKFLVDFGALDKCHYKEVFTREYFLIYAVEFGINKTISTEILKKCNLLD